jgi:hypothetical protein
MYLAFLLNVFYIYVMYFNLHLHYWAIIFIGCFMKYVIYAIRCRTCTCRTFSEPMHHPFRNDASHMNLWDVWLLNCLAYFGQPENDDRCILSGVCLCVSFIHDFSSVTLLFSDTPILSVWSVNSGVMLPKSRMEDTQGRDQITRDDRYS